MHRTIKSSETVKVLAETRRYADIKTGHIPVGPVAIDGAMPGDMLEVHILSVVPSIPYSMVSMRPGAGGIPGEVPLGAFMGVMGVQPPDSDGPNHKSGPPGLLGAAVRGRCPRLFHMLPIVALHGVAHD